MVEGNLNKDSMGLLLDSDVLNNKDKRGYKKEVWIIIICILGIYYG